MIVNLVEGNQVVKSEMSIVSFSLLSVLTTGLIILNLGEDYDSGRGGWGHLKTKQEIDLERQNEQDDLYRNDTQREVPMGGNDSDQDDQVSLAVLFWVRVGTDEGVESSVQR